MHPKTRADEDGNRIGLYIVELAENLHPPGHNRLLVAAYSRADASQYCRWTFGVAAVVSCEEFQLGGTLGVVFPFEDAYRPWLLATAT